MVPPPSPVSHHVRDTVRLATPLAVAQLVQMLMGVTDTVLLGGLGEGALAAGGLGGTFFISAVVILQGVLAAVAVLVSQARGAGRDAEVPVLYWTGLVLTALLVVPGGLFFAAATPLLLWIGEPAALVADVDRYLGVLRWSVPGALLGMGLMRALLPALGGGAILLWVTLAEVGPTPSCASG